MKNNRSVPVFSVKKKHAWRGNLITLVEIILIIIVVAGTIVWLLIANHFSLNSFLKNLRKSVQPQATFESKPKIQSKEDELKSLINNDNVLEISSLIKTPEGDLQITSQNGPSVNFSSKKSLQQQVSTLQTLLAKAKIDNKPLKKVDFRFSKIVVEY